jgi:RNA polymerase sigma factor, sigma-70 family
MEDNKIIELYLLRDEDAIEQSSQKYGQYCSSISLRILNDIEYSKECVNDTWLNAWNSIPPQKPTVLRAFLGKITRNLSLNRLRDFSREKRGGTQSVLVLNELEDCIPDMNTPEKIIEDREVTASIEKWMDTISSESRIAFMRRYWHFEDLRTIASLMGWSEAKTNSLLHRLRLSLKNHLEQEDIEL